MKNITKINYISELNLPNKSAYSIHVMKMCEAFSALGYDINLFVINNKKNSQKVFNSYNIKKRFKIISIFNSFKQFNFLLRIIFAFKILSKNFEYDSIFLSRSIIFALFGSIFNKKIILELHHEITGFSKLIYWTFNFLGLTQNLKFIFLNKELKKIYKIKDKKSVVLDDAINLEDFKKKKLKKFKKTSVYIGSFFEGKGIEQIIRLAKYNKNLYFHIYGEKRYLKYDKKLKNIKIFDYVNYSKIPTILSRYEVALMPYQKKIKGRGSIWLEKYMSPLKMFDYMAAKMIIIASDLKVYSHILKNNTNCKLVKVNDDRKWSKIISLIFKNLNDYRYLKKNAYLTVKKYTWKNRCVKIINLAKKNI